MTVFHISAQDGQKHMLSKMRLDGNFPGGGWTLEIKSREPRVKTRPGVRPGLVGGLVEEHSRLLLAHLAGSEVRLHPGFAILPTFGRQAG